MLKYYIGSNKYRVRVSYQLYSNVTKILIDMFLDSATGFINLTEIEKLGKLNDETIRLVVKQEIEKIENLE